MERVVVSELIICFPCVFPVFSDKILLSLFGSSIVFLQLFWEDFEVYVTWFNGFFFFAWKEFFNNR